MFERRICGLKSSYDCGYLLVDILFLPLPLSSPMFSHEIDDAEVRGDKIADAENTIKLILRLYLERRTRLGLSFPEMVMFRTSGNSMLGPRKRCVLHGSQVAASRQLRERHQ